MIKNDRLRVRIVSSVFMILTFLLVLITNTYFFLFFANILLFLSNWEAIRLLIYKDILDKGNKNLNLSRCKVGADEIALILLINLIIFSFFFSIILFKILLFLLLLVFIIKIKNLNIIKFLTLSYISLAFYFLINFQMNQNFINYLTFIVFFAIIVDVSAYFTGKSLGGRKLAVNLSPNKTVSGSVGGVIIPVIICLVFFGKSHNYLEIIIFSIILSLIAQAGDLIESSFKRFCYVKDTSNIIPGHGGILDRIDSIILLIIFISIMKLFGYNFFFIV